VFRTLYTLIVVSLVGGTAWSAGAMDGERTRSEGQIGIVLPAAL
jgi:hypothetical protein